MARRDEITVVVATYGASAWKTLAFERAVPSAAAQAPVVHKHGATLAGARNAGLAEVRTPFVVHLDADDELEPGYIEAMAAGTADLRAPAVRQVRHGVAGEAFVPNVWGHEHDCIAACLRRGNWLVIGTCVRVDLLRSVGGWEEWEWSEDWAAWARCWRAGGTIETIPAAVYRAHRARRGRNRVGRATALYWHREIERAVFGEVTV